MTRSLQLGLPAIGVDRIEVHRADRGPRALAASYSAPGVRGEVDATGAVLATDRDSWCTPAWVWGAVLRVQGYASFGFDPCANRWSTVPADRRVMLPNDGLAVDWENRWWLNPPYSEIGRWLARASEESRSGTYGWALVPFSPDTRAWHEHGPRHAIVMPRCEYDPPPGIAHTGRAGPVPMALCAYGDGIAVVRRVRKELAAAAPKRKQIPLYIASRG